MNTENSMLNNSITASFRMHQQDHRQMRESRSQSIQQSFTQPLKEGQDRTKNFSSFKGNDNTNKNSNSRNYTYECNSATQKIGSLHYQDSHQLDQQQWQKLDDIIKKIKFNSYIKKFLMQSRKRLYRLLNFQQVKLINDQANYLVSLENENSIYRKLQKNLCIPNFIKKQLSGFPIFNPSNAFLELWQGMKIICVIICFFFQLISFSFEMDLENLLNIQIIYGCQICLAADIIVNLNTAIYLKGQLTTSRFSIFLQYKSSKSLYFDIIQQMSFILYLIIHTQMDQSSRSFSIFLLPIILKLNDLNIVIRKMKNKFLLQKKAQNIFELVNLMKNIFLISHMFACIWILSAKISLELQQSFYSSEKSGNVSSDSKTWIGLMNIQNESWIIQYLYSFYFITVTMITVGYGDVRPTNPLEVGVCIFLMLTCCLIFGFTINSIGQIFQDIFSKEKNILQKRSIIGNYMLKKDINSNTQKSVFEYLEYYWREELDENLGETEKILSQLSTNLKQELDLESNKLILKENRILKDHFSYEVLTKCLPFIQEQHCTPGEVVIDERVGNLEGFLYFIQLGELDVYKQNQEQNNSRGQSFITPIKRLKKGNNFGQRSFFTGEEDYLNVKSVNFSTLIKIKRSDFINILKQSSNEYETYCMIKDKIIFSGYNTQLYDFCSSCGDRTHAEMSCPFLHFIPKKYKIIQQNSISEPHVERQIHYQRSSNQKQNSYVQMEFNLSKLYLFHDENQNAIENYEETNLEYSFFNKNISFSELDDLVDIYQNNNNVDKQQPFSNKEISEVQSEQIIKKTTFYQKYQTPKNILQANSSLQKSQDMEDKDEQNIINLSHSLQCENEQDKEISQINNNRRMSVKQKDLRNRKKNQQNQSNLSIQEQDLLQEMSSPKSIEKQNSSNIGRYRQTIFSNFQPSLKNIVIDDLVQVLAKNPEFIHNTGFKSIQEVQQHQLQQALTLQLQRMNTQINQIDFDIFKGQFDQLCTFKNYFPQFNYKEVIQSMNENSQSQKRSRINNPKIQAKKDNLKIKLQRRNGKRLSNKQNGFNQSNITKNNSPPICDSGSKKTKNNTFSFSNQAQFQGHEDIKCNNDESTNRDPSTSFQNEIKVELERIEQPPLANEEQTHLRRNPTFCYPKRSYFSDKSDTWDLSIQQDFSQVLFKKQTFCNGSGLILIEKEAID